MTDREPDAERAAGDQGAGIPARTRRIQHLSYDAQCVEPVADALGVPVTLAPFRLPGGAVYQLLVPGRDDRPAAMVTLWPTLHRVDAVGGGATVIFTDVVSVDLVGEVEVQFRRSNRDYLIVARGGKIIVRAYR